MNILDKETIQVVLADKNNLEYIPEVIELLKIAAHKEGTGLAIRSAEYLNAKFLEEKAIIAFVNNKLAGFCYIETWDHGKYIANSGLIVSMEFRACGVAKKIKKAAFELSRKKYPNAKMFGLTTSLAVMKINSSLGYVPVTFSELTTDSQFWKGCESCKYYDILVRTKRGSCLCTAMVFNNSMEKENNNKITENEKSCISI
jgi:hypothetical protein